MECIFCKIVQGNIAAKKVLENDHVVAFWDTHPLAQTHFLITTKKHIAGVEAIGEEDKEDLLAIFQAAQRLVSEYTLGGKFKLVANGPLVRHVDHLHFHLLGGEITSHP